MTYIPRILRPKRPRYSRLPDGRFGTFEDPAEAPAFSRGLHDLGIVWPSPLDPHNDNITVVELGPTEWLQPDDRS